MWHNRSRCGPCAARGCMRPLSTLPLMLVARSARQAALLALGGWVAATFWFVQEAYKFGAVWFAAPYVLAGCYLPALWIVLRQRNEGTIPLWVERRVARWPEWLRGIA